MRGSALLILTLAVAGCSGPAPVVDRLGPEPNARKLVSDNTLFHQAGARVTALSKPRPWKYSTFYAWRVCMKALVTDPNGAPRGGTYALFIHANDIADRRQAVADDLCETEQFEPFVPEAPAAVTPAAAQRAESGAFGGMFDWLKLGR